MIRHLARRDVNYLDTIVVDGGDVDLLVIRRQADRHGRASSHRNAVDYLGFLFIENDNGGGVCRQVQCAGAGETGEGCAHGGQQR